MKFYNREKEIETLGQLQKDFRIAVFGRRRIGKTTLIEHYYSKNCLTFFMPAEKAEKQIIDGWADEYPFLPRVNTFKEFFEYAFQQDKVIFLDEIQNVLKVNKSFLYDLQRLIDKHKPRLIVSGSLISMMKKIIEDYKSPLYGRFDYIIKLEELDFRTVYRICKDLNLTLETAFKLYSIFGGIPKYYELIEKLKSFRFEEFILNAFAIYPRPLYEEVRTMLKEEFGKEYKTFFSIISAIAQGRNKSSEIANYIGRMPTEITKYLSMLRNDFEIIERKLPVLDPKKGIYAIKTNITAFWFQNIWKYSQLLETGQEEKAAEKIKANLNKHTALAFEKTIRQLIRSKIIKIPIDFKETGSQWGKFKGDKGKNTYEIDIVALNPEEILFGECKWQENINAEKTAKELIEKAGRTQYGERKEYFAIFAKTFARKITEHDGKKVYCFDLKDIEEMI